MKKILLFLLAGFTTVLSAYDLKTTKGAVYKDYVGLGGPAATGIIVLYGKDCKEVVVPVSEFPEGFPDMKAVERMKEKIPAMNAKAIAEAKKEKAEKNAENKETREKYARLRKMMSSKEGIPDVKTIPVTSKSQSSNTRLGSSKNSGSSKSSKSSKSSIKSK